MSHGPTIRDIADKLGMGKSTVQRALSNCGSISSRSRKLVIDTAEKLGYRPDPLFSILGSQNRQARQNPLRIAYISHFDPLHRAGVDVFHPAKVRAQALGYTVERIEIGELAAGKRLMEVLYFRGFVGVMIGGVRSPDHAAILANDHLPVVCCGRTDPLPLHTVQPDITQMVRLACRRMLDAGYRRIGAALGSHSPPIEDDFDRMGAVLQCQEEALAKNNRVPLFLGTIGDYPALIEWFHRHKPDAVLGFHIGQYYALRDSGVDMSRIGFACLHIQAKDPVFAGIIEPLDSIPREALNLLDQLIRHRSVGVPEEPLHILLPGQWNEGASLPAIPHKS